MIYAASPLQVISLTHGISSLIECLLQNFPRKLVGGEILKHRMFNNLCILLNCDSVSSDSSSLDGPSIPEWAGLVIVSIFVMRDVNWYTMTSASTPDAINSFAVITVFLASPERAALSKLVSLLFGTRPTWMQKNKENHFIIESFCWIQPRL